MAGVFAGWNPNAAGGVIRAAKPRVTPYPRIPTYSVGANGHRQQPDAKGNFFVRQGGPAQPLGSVNPTNSPAPAMTDMSLGGSSPCSCGGCGNRT